MRPLSGLRTGAPAAGEGLEAVGEVLPADDVDGAAFGERGADAVGADDPFGRVEPGANRTSSSRSHNRRPPPSRWIIRPRPSHTAMVVPAVGERDGQVGEDRVGGVQERVVEGEVGGVGHEQLVRFEPRGAAPLPGVQDRVPDVRVDPRTGQESFVGVDEPTDVVPGDGQQNHFPHPEVGQVACLRSARPRRSPPSHFTVDLL